LYLIRRFLSSVFRQNSMRHYVRVINAPELLWNRHP
jgi:hypothetical protein